MMLPYLWAVCLLLYTQAHPGERRRLKRDEEIGGITYAPCKDTYAQCVDWKRNGMCDMPQYKDYMPLVCTDTCGFCKEVKQQEAATNKDQIDQQPTQQQQPQIDQTTNTIQNPQPMNPPQPDPDVGTTKDQVSTAATPETTTLAVASSKEEYTNMSESDKVMQTYADTLKKYYDDIEERNKAYQESVQKYLAGGQTAQYIPPSLLTGIPDNTITPSTNNISSPDSRDLSSPLGNFPKLAESDIAPSGVTPNGVSAAYTPNYAPRQPYQPNPAQPNEPVMPEPGSSSSSSSSSGSKSSSTSSSSSGTSVSVGVGVGGLELNSTNSTETPSNESNVTITDASSLPSKVAPETPALPALPPLLVLPQISETLLIDETTPKLHNSSLEKQDVDDKDKAALQQATDALPYAPERDTPLKTDSKVKVKGVQKLEKDRKITTEDQQTNEMTHTESKHLASLVHNLDDEANEEEEEPKIIKTFSNQPGQLHLNKVNIKNKNLDADLKDAKKSAKESSTKPSENEDDVFKHDEKSGSVSGSGAGPAEENFEDLNYITDFNPDDFDMDVPDLAHKDFMSKNKRNVVAMPRDHPLFSRFLGIQKRRNEITAPRIIDATENAEDGDNSNNNNAVISFSDTAGHPRSKIHTRSQTNLVAKAETTYKEDLDESGEEESDEEDEGSAKPGDEKSKLKKDKKKPVLGEKKDKIKEKTAKKAIRKKDKVVSVKSKVAAHKKSKVISLLKNASEKDGKEPKHISKEKSEVSELMSEKGDTAAVRNKKADKKSSTREVKARSKAEENNAVSRKDIPRNKEEPLSASVVITYSKRGKSSKKDPDRKAIKSIGTEATIADLSGAGSGETDTDMLSGDGSYRSLVESGDDSDALEEGEEEEEFGGETRDKTGHQSSDPEKIHITPQANLQKQPDLNDFPAGKSAKHKESKGSFKEETQSTVTEAAAQARTDNSTGTEEVAEETPAETAETTQEGSPVAAALDMSSETAPETTENANAASETAEVQPEAEGVEENEQDGGEINDVKIEELLSPNEDKKKDKKKDKEKDKALNEGKISMVLSQNFNELYGKKDSPSYQMLAGNIKKDIEKMIKATAVKDLSFSEVSVEGNPRQSGKTKVSFNVDAANNEWMKKLLKLVDSGDIDGLRVIKGSLEIEEEKKKR